MGRYDQLGELQLDILRVLWQRGESTVVEVHEALSSTRSLAPTTVATMLGGLEKKGVVDHRSEGRRFVYRALIREGETKQRLVDELVDRVFRGDRSELVNHLLDGGVDADTLAELRRRIDSAQEEGER